MLRKEMFINQRCENQHTNISTENKIIFLDIDGVIQPLGKQGRFDHDMEATREYLAETYNNPYFLEINEYDLAAAFYDWNFAAIGVLRELVEEDDCKIVIHSSWREYKTLEQLKALFQIYSLEESVIGATDKGNKTESIIKYLTEHKEIDSYVVIDDDKALLYDFGSEFCFTHNILATEDYKHCQTALQNEFEIRQKDSVINCYINNEIYMCLSSQELKTKDITVYILSMFECSGPLESQFVQCLINELIKHLAITRPDLSGMILLEHDWKCRDNILHKAAIYKESAQAFYLPTQRGSPFFSLKIDNSWRDIEKTLSILRQSN